MTLSALSTGIIPRCGQHADVDGAGLSFPQEIELWATDFLPAARCPSGCYCVRDRFAWRCVVCHQLC